MGKYEKRLRKRCERISKMFDVPPEMVFYRLRTIEGIDEFHRRTTSMFKLVARLKLDDYKTVHDQMRAWLAGYERGGAQSDTVSDCH